jgi:hypothetical protein
LRFLQCYSIDAKRLANVADLDPAPCHDLAPPFGVANPGVGIATVIQVTIRRADEDDLAVGVITALVS